MVISSQKGEENRVSPYLESIVGDGRVLSEKIRTHAGTSWSTGEREGGTALYHTVSKLDMNIDIWGDFVIKSPSLSFNSALCLSSTC